MKGWDEQGDFFPFRPINLWRCNGCGYVDVVRPESDDLCGGCGRLVDGAIHTFRPDPMGIRTDKDRLKVVPDPEAAA